MVCATFEHVVTETEIDRMKSRSLQTGEMQRLCQPLQVRNGRYGHFQRYFYKDCSHTFNHKTGTIFAHSKMALRRWWFSIYAFLRFNTSFRQLQCEIEVTYKTIYWRIEHSGKALNAPSLDLVGSVEISLR